MVLLSEIQTSIPKTGFPYLRHGYRCDSAGVGYDSADVPGRYDQGALEHILLRHHVTEERMRAACRQQIQYGHTNYFASVCFCELLCPILMQTHGAVLLVLYYLFGSNLDLLRIAVARAFLQFDPGCGVRSCAFRRRLFLHVPQWWTPRAHSTIQWSE